MLMSRWRQPELVWYAAYGSNLRQERFLRYIEGGRVEGNVRRYQPCADPTPPRQVLPLSLPYQLFFAGESRAWTGGVAFIKAGGDGSTRSRAYLLSYKQYVHLVCGENNVSSLPPLPMAEATSRGSAIIPGLTGRYDQLVYFGHRGRYPVFTTTASTPETINPPAPAYLIQVIMGLQELRHSPDEIVCYLHATPGVTGHYSSAQLRTLVWQATETQNSPGTRVFAEFKMPPAARS
jgi:hypothetical protein